MTTEDDGPGFTPLAMQLLDGLSEQCEVEMITDTAIDVIGPFDIEQLATYIRAGIEARWEAYVQANPLIRRTEIQP